LNASQAREIHLAAFALALLLRILGGPRSPATEQPGIMGLRISPPDSSGYCCRD
jgi:hypothetical protein